MDLPEKLYSRPLGNGYYTEQGILFCSALDERLSAYRYSASTYDTDGEVVVWTLTQAQDTILPIPVSDELAAGNTLLQTLERQVIEAGFCPAELIDPPPSESRDRLSQKTP